MDKIGLMQIRVDTGSASKLPFSSYVCLLACLGRLVVVDNRASFFRSL